MFIPPPIVFTPSTPQTGSGAEAMRQFAKAGKTINGRPASEFNLCARFVAVTEPQSHWWQFWKRATADHASREIRPE